MDAVALQEAAAFSSSQKFVSRGRRLKKYKKEAVDEMAEANLHRCDSICLYLGKIALIVIGFACAIGRFVLTTEVIGPFSCHLLLVFSSS